MYDRKNRKIKIVIEGADYDKLEAFEKEHEECLSKHPNVTGGHFKIETVVDGMGLFKKATCVCGKSVALTGEYSLGDDHTTPESEEPVFQVIPEDPETEELLKMLLLMKRRPGMFFGKKRDVSLLTSFTYGFECAARIHNPNMGWSHIQEKVFQEYCLITGGQTYDDGSYSEEERFQLYLDIIEKILKRDFPEYTKKFAELQ